MIEEQEAPIQYALGEPARRTGLAGLSMRATVVLACGFGAFLLFQLMGLGRYAFTVVIPLTFAVTAIISIRVTGRSLAQYVQMMWQDYRRRSTGAHIYVSGGLSRVPGGRRRLPGLLARTETKVGFDSLGREFVAVLDRPRREATVILDIIFTGQTAMTQAERNAMTADWSRWLAQLSLSGDIEQIVVVVATRPGSGSLVANEVADIIADGAPEIARRGVLEAAAVISVARPEVLGHIAITVKYDSTSIKDDSFLNQLGTRIPGWASTLQWAGMMATPLSCDGLVSRIHSFYNPASEPDFERLMLDGVGHGLEWADAGPSVAETLAGCYKHDGVQSVTWEMREAPRSTFEDTLLQSLIVPHDRVVRKRVALCYRPFEAGVGASRVEAEHRDAMVAANSSKKITSATAEIRLEHTEAARRAQARGAQLGRFSLFVTATVGQDEDLLRVVHDVEQLGAGSSIRLRPMRYQQDVGFQITCGVGQVPWRKQSTSSVASTSS